MSTPTTPLVSEDRLLDELERLEDPALVEPERR
jgi:hypothetical protein